jgi:hypothetical protein
LLLQVGRSVFLIVALRGRPQGEHFVNVLVWELVAGALWVAGAIADGDARLVLWGLAVAWTYGGVWAAHQGVLEELALEVEVPAGVPGGPDRTERLDVIGPASGRSRPEAKRRSMCARTCVPSPRMNRPSESICRSQAV